MRIRLRYGKLFERFQLSPEEKEDFKELLAARQAGGATQETLVLRNVDDPREIMLLLGWRDLERAKSFAQSVSLGMALQTMGVVGKPEVRFLERVICRFFPEHAGLVQPHETLPARPPHPSSSPDDG